MPGGLFQTVTGRGEERRHRTHHPACLAAAGFFPMTIFAVAMASIGVLTGSLVTEEAEAKAAQQA
ncbi:MAG TPA: hypothetical protein VMV50_02555 [Candidatus Paceibacterota bacterium]|nr:hypothetical protein [Candidatus Paceibacterota bacterium]